MGINCNRTDSFGTNGYLTFSKTEGIDLHFVGNNKEEIYDFAFSTAKEPYSMTIKLSNINVKTELAQYGYDGKEVVYEGGLLNMDLTIASSGMLGWIAFDGVDIKYIDLDDTIKGAKGRVEFKPEGIFLNAKALVFDKPEEFSLSFKDGELNIDFDLADIKKKNLEKLSYLKGVDLPFKELNVDRVKFNLNMKEELKVNIDAFVKRVEIENLNLIDTKVNFLYDKDGIHLSKIYTILNQLNEKNEIVLSEEINGELNFWEGKGDLSLNIKNINNKNYIPNFDGKLEFQILGKEIKLNLNSNIINLMGQYLSEEKKIQLDKEKEYFLEYDLNNKKITTGEGKINFSLFNNNFLLDYSVYNNGIN